MYFILKIREFSSNTEHWIRARVLPAPYLLSTVYFWFFKTNLLKTGRKKVLKASEMCSAQILYENMKYVRSKTFVTIKTIYKPFQNSLFDYFNV